jgi:hypothetical protein
MNTTDDLKDYAYPCMMAENALRRVHNALLANHHETATQEALVALTECCRLLDAIRYMKDRYDAVRQ